MHHRKRLFVFLILLIAASLTAQVLSGSASIKLNGPATNEEIGKVSGSAREKIKSEILAWLEDNVSVTLDTGNSLHNFILDNFVDTCLSRIKEESTFSGKTVTLSFTLPDDTVRSAVQIFNSAVDEIAISSWNAMSGALAEKNWMVFYTEAIKALAFSIAHLGPPLPTPQAEGRNLSDDIRLSINNFFKKLKFESSDMILQGKAGEPVKTPPVITVTIDSQAVEGLGFTAVQQGGAELYSVITNAQGRISLSEMKIPFVANGALLHIKINPGMVLKPGVFIGAEDFRLKNGPEQPFIFKLARHSYTLDYKAVTVSELALPPDFTSDAHVRKFLKDSCYMQEATGGLSPDLSIIVQSQVSSYKYDETEQIGLKAQSQITIKGMNFTQAKTESEQIVFEKRYEQGSELPFGLFLWEANNRLRQGIKAALNRM